MRNVTIRIADDVARWVRMWAAEHDTSISALVSETLKAKMEMETGRLQALDRFMSRSPVNLSQGQDYPARDALYER